MFHLSMKMIDHINFLNLNQDLKVQLIWKVTLCQFMRKIRNINVWYAIKNSNWNVPWKSTSLWFMNQRNLLSVQFVMLWLYHIGSSDISFRKEKEKGKSHTNAPFIHENSKNSKPEFKSDVCMVIFTQIKSSTGHIREVHEGQKPYLFGICKKQFSRNYILKSNLNSSWKE